MTILFSGQRTMPAGAFESSPFNVTAHKVPLQALRIRVSFIYEDLPTGTTTITVFVSGDGGNTWRSAFGTYAWPVALKGSPPHQAVLEYGFLPNEVATHMKYATNSPSQWTTTATVEAITQA